MTAMWLLGEALTFISGGAAGFALAMVLEARRAFKRREQRIFVSVAQDPLRLRIPPPPPLERKLS